MINITREIRKEVRNYLECDYARYSDKFYAFYYRCMKAGVHYADADRYAILNTLLNYDIGMDNAMAIDNWMYEHDEDIYELDNSEESKKLVMKASTELDLNLDFSKWINKNYKHYKFFE